MRLAIILGHSAASQGAKAYNGMTEWAWNLDLTVNHLLPYLRARGIKCVTFWRNYTIEKSSGYDASIQELSQRVSEYKPGASIELHFNAFNGVSKVWRGECLHGRLDGSKRLAELFAGKMKDFMDINVSHPDINYDVKLNAAIVGNRGFKNVDYLELQEIPTALLEPCFADVEHEVSRAVIENPKEYAIEVLGKMVEDFMGV